jgi:hypothetical protein
MAKDGKGLLVALGLGDESEGDESNKDSLCGDILKAIEDKDKGDLSEALDAYIGDYIDGLRGDEDDDSDDY